MTGLPVCDWCGDCDWCSGERFDRLSNYGVSDSDRFVTKDSGVREEYASGMRRDTQKGKPDFSLCVVPGLPYGDQMLTRWAALMSRGAEKYGRENWQLANSAEELDRFKASAFRHFMQWFCGEIDEDHAAAVFFNVNAYEAIKAKLAAQDEVPE